MAQPNPPVPVKYFIAVLFPSPDALNEAREFMVEKWGEIDYEGDDHLFDVTEYYRPEMGGPLFRRLISLKALASPTVVVDMKLQCNDFEESVSSGGKRVVNLDAGYLDHNKVLLASAKEAGQKVYLDKGIYADLAGRYRAGRYQPFEWSFPDFRDGRYDRELLTIRTLYMKQLREWRTA